MNINYPKVFCTGKTSLIHINSMKFFKVALSLKMNRLCASMFSHEELCILKSIANKLGQIPLKNGVFLKWHYYSTKCKHRNG